MLERIREGSQGVAAKIVLGFVIITFALAGIGSYLGQSTNLPAALVNGEEISQNQFEQAYRNERSRMEQQFGDMFSQLAADENYMNTFRDGILDRLIAEQLQDQSAKELGLRVSDEAIKKAIAQMPEFQLDGKFDKERYLAVLRQAGFQPSSFGEYMRTEMTRRQFVQSVAATNFALDSEAIAQEKIAQQTRDIQYTIVEADRFRNDVELTDELLSQHYQLNIAQHQTDETVKLHYVELNSQDLLDAIVIDDEQIQQYYDDNLVSYSTEEKRRVSHILIEFGEDESAAETSANELLTKIVAGEDFAELAKAHSQDTFSGEQGGDLDFIEKGVMDAEFEAAAFDLANVGDNSQVVRSEFGFHIIKLTDLKEGSVKPLSDVSADIALKLKADSASEQFFDLQQQLGEVSFEIPDSLDDAAAAINKEVVETEFFSRLTAPELIRNERVLAAAFSEQVIVEGLNSELIELGNEHVVVLRAVEHKPAETKSFEDVKSIVTESLTNKLSSEAAETFAQALVDSIEAGAAFEAESIAKNVELTVKNGLSRNASDVNFELTKKAFTLGQPADSNKSIEMTRLNNGDVAVVELLKVIDGTIPEDLTPVKQRLESTYAQSEYGNFIEQLKTLAVIEKPQVQ